MVPKHAMCTEAAHPDVANICLFAGHWGCIFAHVREFAPGRWRFFQSSPLIRIVHVSSWGVEISLVAGEFCDESGLVIRELTPRTVSPHRAPAGSKATGSQNGRRSCETMGGCYWATLVCGRLCLKGSWVALALAAALFKASSVYPSWVSR